MPAACTPPSPSGLIDPVPTFIDIDGLPSYAQARLYTYDFSSSSGDLTPPILEVSFLYWAPLTEGVKCAALAEQGAPQRQWFAELARGFVDDKLGDVVLYAGKYRDQIMRPSVQAALCDLIHGTPSCDCKTCENGDPTERTVLISHSLGGYMLMDAIDEELHRGHNLTSSTGATTSTRNSLDASAIHLLRWNNWFYSGVVNFLQSSEQGISLQSSLGGGVGRYLINTNRASISVIGGAAWQNTKYQQSIASVTAQNLVAALIYGDVQFFRFSKTNLNVTAGLLPAVSEPGRVRFNTNASYYVKLFSNLKWNVSFYGNWDNQPPAGFSGSDYGSTSGLSWTYGLK